MKSRRGVGGLISMVGLVIVFGVIAVTLMALNGQQTSVIATGHRVAELQHDRTAERLDLEFESCTAVIAGKTNLSINVTNAGSETSRITTLLLLRDAPVNVTDNFDTWTDLSTIDNKIVISPSKIDTDFVRPFIASGNDASFRIQDAQVTLISTDPDQSATKMMIVTELGNKFVSPFDIADCP